MKTNTQLKLIQRPIIEKFLSKGTNTPTEELKDRCIPVKLVPLDRNAPKQIAQFFKTNKEMANPDKFDLVVEFVEEAKSSALPTKTRFEYSLLENEEELQKKLYAFRQEFVPPAKNPLVRAWHYVADTVQEKLMLTI